MRSRRSLVGLGELVGGSWDRDWGGLGDGRTEVKDELDDLEHGDILFPPDANTAGALEVVPVHDDVYHQVDRDGNP